MKKFLLALMLLAMPLYAANGITTGTTTLLPSINAISFTATFTGDDDGDATALVQYRVNGSSTWLDAYAPLIDRRATLNGVANPYVNQARVSIVGLLENTLYDVQITWTDADGVTGTNPVTSMTTTIDSTPPVDSATTRNVTDDATLATALAAMNPGDRINLGGSYTYSPFTIARAGNSGAYINFVCGAGSSIESPSTNYSITVSADYIVIDGCTFGDTQYTAILFSGVRTHIYIKNNTMTNISADCAIMPENHPNDSGVRMTSTSNNIFILDNTITSTALLNPSCTLVPANTSPGQAVQFSGSAQHTVVIKGNTISGGFRDGISASNSGTNLENIDIQGNTISQAKDDLTDTKGYGLNVRVWENVLTQDMGFSCIATNTNTASLVYGPVFIFRNTCYVTAGAATGTVYKIGGTPTYLFHNSSDGTAKGTTSSGWETITCGGAVCTTLTARNNAIISGRGSVISWRDGSTLNYDVLNTTGATNYVRAWNGSTNYSTVALFNTGTSQEANGIQGSPLFLNSALDIDDTSPGFDTGVVLANFNDSPSRWPYSGAAPDIGVFEVTAGPVLTSVTASSGAEGATVAVTLAGSGFQGGNAAIAISGTGVTINSTVVVSDVSITANFVIAAGATVSARNVTVTTDDGVSGAATFTVTCTSTSVAFSSQPTGTGLGLTLGTVSVQVLCGDATVNTGSSASIVLAKDMAATWGTLASASNLTKSATTGTATWTDLSVTTTAGAGSITAASSGLTGATSNSITITTTVVGSGKPRLRGRIR